MNLPLFWIDAFADRVFAGNPAAVVPLESWPEDGVMQQIAFENGLAETAFFVRTSSDRFHLRWFTPALEVDLCGHATLASAFALFMHLDQPGERVTFDSRSGPLLVTRRGSQLELDFPARPALPITSAAVPAALFTSLRPASPIEWLKVTTHSYYVATFNHEADVRALQPDLPAIASLGDIRLIATAPGNDCDFVSRFFAPGAGVPEDPVTGSAHCTLVPHWATRLGKATLHARQVSRRGGELHCTLAHDRVRIAGTAVLYLRGEITV